MSIHRTQLKRAVDQQLIEAELHDELVIDNLFDAEEIWAPERVRFLRDYAHSGVSQGEFPESVHWNWALKAFEILPNLDGFGSSRLFGITCEGAWQGLLFASSFGHVSRLDPAGRDLVYIEYVETAPWNWDLPAANRSRRFKGIGRQLVELAVQWSLDVDLKGLVGLHALSQADDFYRNACSMTDLGPDSGYNSLRYYEFTEQQVREFLGEA